jgi:stage II sporulation protein M
VKFDSFWRYLAAIRPYLLISTALFIASFWMGYGYAFMYPETAQGLFEALQRMIAQRITDPGALSMTYTIFLNNLLASFIVLSGGLGLGVLSVTGIMFNGIILGMVVYVVKSESLLLFSILPHGIIELPIFLISTAIGLRIGHEVLNKLRRKGEPSIIKELKEGLTFYLRWIIPLLLLAALIEATVSMRIAQLLR